MSKKFLIWLGKLSLAFILASLARIAFSYAGYQLPNDLGREYYFGISVGLIAYAIFSGWWK